MMRLILNQRSLCWKKPNRSEVLGTLQSYATETFHDFS